MTIPPVNLKRLSARPECACVDLDQLRGRVGLSWLGVVPLLCLAGRDQLMERLGIRAEVARILGAVRAEPLVALAAGFAERAGALDRAHLDAAAALLGRLDAQIAQHGGEPARRARMIADQRWKLRRVDADIVEHAVELARLPEVGEFGAERGAVFGLGDRAGEPRRAAADQGHEPL